ncbi:MAG: hypothetical protein JXB88_11375 [Spirochaetales bacterium]|nr:hypothetical protein [Spirochaetales bacterium]
MVESLLFLDTVSIKKYIFASRQLKEIRGASALLDEYNRFKTEETIKTITGGDYKKIYACGGSGLFIIPTVKAESIKNTVSTLYAEIDAEIIIVYTPYSEETDDFLQARFILHFKAGEGYYQSRHVTRLSYPLFRDCDSDKRKFVSVKENDEFISYSITKKREKNRQIKNEIKQAIKNNENTGQTLWSRLNLNLMEAGYPDIADLKFPDDFGKIADYDPGGYIAMIYADGNNMGKIVNGIKDRKDMEFFSHKVDEALYYATAKAIAQHLMVDTLHKNNILPFDILLIGGDDLIMVVPACYGLKIAMTLSQEFSDCTKKAFKKFFPENNTVNLSVSTGVSFTKPNYPIFSLLTITENLLKSAKKERTLRLQDNKNDKLDCGLVNYMLIQHSGIMDWEACKRNIFIAENKEETYFRTCRPFTIEELENLLVIAEKLKEVSFSPGKLQILRDASFKSYYEACFQTLFILTRCKTGKKGNKGEKETVEELLTFPSTTGRKDFYSEKGSLFCLKKKNNKTIYKTAILDLLDIYTFVNQPGDKNHEEQA